MSLTSEGWIPGLTQFGPPPGANDDVFLVQAWYRKNSVAEVKQIASREVNRSRLLILTGQDSAFDGLLQGIYACVWTDELDISQGNDASYIIANDGKSAWRKLT
jgi:hypothetical protein